MIWYALTFLLGFMLGARAMGRYEARRNNGSDT